MWKASEPHSQRDWRPLLSDGRARQQHRCGALRGRLAGRGLRTLLRRYVRGAIRTDLAVVGMNMGRHSGRPAGGLGSGTLAVAAAGGCGAAAAAQTFALEQEARGQPGESGQEQEQYGEVKFHGRPPVTRR